MPTSEPQYLYLTTIGRRTRLPREIEIWFTQRDGRFYLIAEHRERAHWVQNIQHDPRIRFRVAEQAFVGRGRVVDREGEPELWSAIRRLSEEKYGWSEGLIVELVPE